MLPTREKQHLHRVPYIQKNDVSVLPIASIYGGNASGKSNFIAALKRFRSFIIERRELMSDNPVDPFCLDDAYINRPSSFEIEFLADDNIYRYTLSASRQKITYEKLVKINENSESVLYKRKESKIENIG
jgi:AAA15 family ATPase/GTPase